MVISLKKKHINKILFPSKTSIDLSYCVIKYTKYNTCTE